MPAMPNAARTLIKQTYICNILHIESRPVFLSRQSDSCSVTEVHRNSVQKAIGSSFQNLCESRLILLAVSASQVFSHNLTFRGPCIMIYSYNKNQLDALFLKFILV